MSGQPLAVLRTGLLTAVGLTAPASCAAIRAKVTNPQETGFLDGTGTPIMGCSVPLDRPWRAGKKLATMAAMAIEECLAEQPRASWPAIPLWLCVAEHGRPGRIEKLDEQLYLDITQQLGARFSDKSAIVPQGRCSIGTALFQARRLIYEESVPYVLIAAADSLLSWPTLSVFERAGRILIPGNSNGFIPGEAA